ncbi:MAG: YifB family Mg chelatase-like AAA ATPase [Trueperaceae bacterium]|nr:YifB family Mg chelatase-like AAA ATPase [Trueperaceae bacterium]
MLAKVISAAVLGVDAYEVQIEVDISGGLPSVMVVGLPDAAVQESRERVRSAIRNVGLPFPSSRIVVNLAPADVRKEGPAFDLPIAVAILVAQGVVSQEAVADTVFSGELALDGQLRPLRGAINISLYAAQAGVPKVVVPPENAAEAAVVDGVAVYAPKTLAELTEFLQGRRDLTPAEPVEVDEPETLLDLQDVRGQAAAKRALEIAAAGSHNLLMTGPPGSGKTMLARRLPSILPPLEQDAAIEVTRIHSTAGTLQRSGLIRHAPFRSPHHTVSDAGLIGGGNIPRPGEVSLAHRGVLFMDEFPEFNRRVLEVLRQPLEDGMVTISRARAALTFPARFMLVASQNPCPCGHYGDPKKACTCSPVMRQRYKERISGPLADRIDLRFSVPRLSAEELLHAPAGEASEAVRQRVTAARRKALERQDVANAELAGRALQKHAALTGGSEAFLRSVIRQLALTARSYDRLRRVARTIADLAGDDVIREAHLAEAVSYRETV